MSRYFDKAGVAREKDSMELKTIDHKLSVCKVADISYIDLAAEFYFIGKTDEELSLVCKTD